MLQGFSEQYLLAMGGVWVALLLSLFLFAATKIWRSSKRVCRWGARVFLVSWVTLATACLFETCFALFYDATDSFGLAKTSQRWNQRHIHLNNFGFRDRKDFTLKPKEAVFRLLLVGDSFTFGHGVAEPEGRFGDILEQRGREATGGRFEIYNLSQPGLSTAGAIQLLTQQFQSGMTGDAVLYVYNLNDVEDLSEDSKYIIGTIILDQPQNVILREAYLPNFLYYRFSQLSRPEVRDYFHWLQDAYTGDAWKRQAEQFDRLRELCQAHDVTLSVVVFPFLHDLGDYKFSQAHQTLMWYWKEHETPTLDLLPVMRYHQNERLVVNRYDAHPNERAHALAADAIWSELLKLQLENRRSGASP